MKVLKNILSIASIVAAAIFTIYGFSQYIRSVPIYDFVAAYSSYDNVLTYGYSIYQQV